MAVEEKIGKELPERERVLEGTGGFSWEGDGETGIQFWGISLGMTRFVPFFKLGQFLMTERQQKHGQYGIFIRYQQKNFH